MVLHSRVRHVGRTLTIAFTLVLVVAGLIGLLLATGSTVSAADPGQGTDDLEIEGDLENASGTVELVVRLEGATLPADDDAVETTLEDHADRTQEPLLEYADADPNVTVLETFWIANAVVLEVDTDETDLEAFGQIEAVTDLHANVEVPIPETEPVEPTTDRDVGAHNDGGETDREGTPKPDGGDDSPAHVTPGLDTIDAPAVWETHETRGEGVRVAVLDTGVDVSHPDIDLYTRHPGDPTYPGGWAEFDDRGERVNGSMPHDPNGHGTHVSGTVAGGHATGTAIGVAPDADLLHGLVLGEEAGTFAQILAGLEWALEEDADVVTLSLGVDGYVEELIAPMAHAEASGAVVVSAIGNDGHGTSSSPGNVYGELSVGAVSDGGDVAEFSGGETIHRDQWTAPGEEWPESYTVPAVVAPGVNVPSAVPGGYARYSGTSMAAPHVAGAAALVRSADAEATVADVESALYETSRHPAAESGDEYAIPDERYGYGIVNASAAVDRVLDDRSTESVVDETTEDDGRVSPPDASDVAPEDEPAEAETDAETDAGDQPAEPGPGTEPDPDGTDGTADANADPAVPPGYSSAPRGVGLVVPAATLLFAVIVAVSVGVLGPGGSRRRS